MVGMDDVLKDLEKELDPRSLPEEETAPAPAEDAPEAGYDEAFDEEYEDEYEDDEDWDEDWDDDWDEEKPRRKIGKRGIVIGVIAAVAVVLAAAALWVNAHYVFAGGLYPRDAQTLDLRDKTLSWNGYEKLTEKLPGCEIHWNVPIGGERYDCCSETLVLTELKDGEESRLALFTELTALDITALDISVNTFRGIQSALPDCSIRWTIPIGSGRYDSAATEITLADFSVADVALFEYFEDLKKADGNGCSCYDALALLQQAMPETEVLWTVALDGAALPRSTQKLELDGAGLDRETLTRYLAWLPELTEVSLKSVSMTAEEQLALVKEYPNITFSWPVTLLGKTYDSTVTHLSFANRTDLTPADIAAIEESLVHFHGLEELDMRGSGVSDEQMRRIRTLCPEGAAVYWDLEILGVAATTADTELDLSGIAVEDLDALKETFACMPRLEKVYMCDCGVADEAMAALGETFADTRFVWNVQIGPYTVRTDATGFIGTSDMFVDLTNEDCEPLKYCTDLQALDLGHKSITHLEFVRHMPDLKYLIISRSQVRSLAPLADLKNLTQLEAFLIPVSDLEVLLECPNLKDLHIAYIGLDRDNPETVDIICQMTQLERLWYGDNLMTDDNENKMKAALPNCHFHEVYKRDHVFLGGWREHERYYEMRDILGMFYMNEQGIEVPYKVLDGEWIFPGDERY